MQRTSTTRCLGLNHKRPAQLNSVTVAQESGRVAALPKNSKASGLIVQVNAIFSMEKDFFVLSSKMGIRAFLLMSLFRVSTGTQEKLETFNLILK
jgi:hypothetical protein